MIYSYLGHRCISGDVESVKFLYGNICYESPPLIQTISLLQECLTIKMLNDPRNNYSNEFLYYFGMICTGWTSRLIVKDLDIATACFEKIKAAIPKAEARLAFIELLLSDEEPYKSDNNARRLGVLRDWAGKRDMFSKIVLAKIVYHSFLIEQQEQQEDLVLMPIRALRLLEIPCQLGHPEAIRFYNTILDNTTGIDTFNIGRQINFSRINIDVLYDC